MDNIQDFKNFLHSRLLGYVSRAITSKRDADAFFLTVRGDFSKHVWDLLCANDEKFFADINSAIDELKVYTHAFGKHGKWCTRFSDNLRIYVGSAVFEHSN
jgi:hypothetical protein